jgi:hypothetical protein
MFPPGPVPKRFTNGAEGHAWAEARIGNEQCPRVRVCIRPNSGGLPGISVLEPPPVQHQRAGQGRSSPRRRLATSVNDRRRVLQTAQRRAQPSSATSRSRESCCGAVVLVEGPVVAEPCPARALVVPRSGSRAETTSHHLAASGRRRRVEGWLANLRGRRVVGPR